MSVFGALVPAKCLNSGQVQFYIQRNPCDRVVFPGVPIPCLFPGRLTNAAFIPRSCSLSFHREWL